MDLFDVIRICFRRWYIFLVIFAIGLVGAAFIYEKATLTYTGTLSLGIAGPAQASIDFSGPNETPATNTLLSNGGTVLLANLLSVGLRDSSYIKRVDEAGGSGGYTVDILTKTTAETQLPVDVVSVSDPSSARVTRTLAFISASADQTLTQIQLSANVAQGLLAHVFPVVALNPPTASTPHHTRAAAGVAIAGAIVAVILAILIDNYVWRRRRQDDSGIGPR